MPSGYTRSRARFSRDYSGNDRSYYQKPRSNPLFSFLITFIIIAMIVIVILIFRPQIMALFNGAKPTATPTATPMLTPPLTSSPTPTEDEPTPTPTLTPEPSATLPPFEDITMNIVGNIVIDTPVLKAAKDSSGNYDFAPLFADVKDQLANADITMGTLGTTISGSGSDYTGSPKYNTPDVVLAALKDAGFDVLNLAHPHIFDHGYDGAIGTKSAIDAQSPLLTSAGLFTSKDDYRNIVNPLIPGGKSMPIAVLSYCDFAKRPSVLSSAQWSYVIKNDNVEDTIKPEIKAARETKGAQIVIVLLNWGSGSSSLKTPSTAMQTEAQAIIKAGADLVIGTGPDYMQKLEKVTYTKDGLSKTGIIAYSLGNFVSDNTSTAGKDCSAILHVTFEKDNATNTITIKDASYVPTFVYVDSNSKYSILPAGKYANTPDLLSQLKSSARTRIKKVWEDVKTLFGSSVATPVDVLPPPADATQPGDTDAGQTGETTPPDGTTDPGGTNAPG